MILRFLNWQGIAGIAASIALATLLVVQKIETGHWRKQSAPSSSCTAASRRCLPERSPTTVPPPTPRAPPIGPTLPGSPQNSARSTKGLPMTIKRGLPLLVLLLSACASPPKPQPIPALAEARQCPPFPLPPAALLKAPAKTDFLDPTD